MTVKKEDRKDGSPNHPILPFGGEEIVVGEGDATTPSLSPAAPELKDVATGATAEIPSPVPVVYPPGRNSPDADYSHENTPRYEVGNWQGYRNYRCKWPGCDFATVSNPARQIIEDHYRDHLAKSVVEDQERLTSSLYDSHGNLMTGQIIRRVG